MWGVKSNCIKESVSEKSVVKRLAPSYLGLLNKANESIGSVSSKYVLVKSKTYPPYIVCKGTWESSDKILLFPSYINLSVSVCSWYIAKVTS